MKWTKRKRFFFMRTAKKNRNHFSNEQMNQREISFVAYDNAYHAPNNINFYMWKRKKNQIVNKNESLKVSELIIIIIGDCPKDNIKRQLSDKPSNQYTRVATHFNRFYIWSSLFYDKARGTVNIQLYTNTHIHTPTQSIAFIIIISFYFPRWLPFVVHKMTREREKKNSYYILWLNEMTN